MIAVQYKYKCTRLTYCTFRHFYFAAPRALLTSATFASLSLRTQGKTTSGEGQGHMVILELAGSATAKPCGVPGCDAISRYECPRCHVPYCTASCYGAHSKSCVDAFQNDVDVRLKNVKVSDWERRRFNSIVERVREAGFYGGTYEDPVLEDSDEDVMDCSEMQEEETPHEGDVPELLEQFINSLDAQGKEFVSMIDKGVRERLEEQNLLVRGEGAASLIPDVGKEALSSPAGGKKARHDRPANAPESADGVAEKLEELTHDMEAQDLSYDEILRRLPEGMARDFEARLLDGRASRMLQLWRPWWIFLPVADTVENDGTDGSVAELPPLPSPDSLLVPISVSRRASPTIVNNVSEVLGAYCMSLRLCNGDWYSDPSHVARKIWEFSPVLSDDRRYASVEEACTSSMGKLVQVGKSKAAALEALNDVSAVISGRSEWVARALYECQRIFEAALAEAPAMGKTHLKARVRKIAYLVSWALCQDTSALVVAARAVLSYAELERGRCEEVRVAGEAIRLSKRAETRIEMFP